ncbi:MFS transporter [Nonomuraea soli]|uniref:Putative MFS family arabinose efflux permease n=1 Tax=Nonomuraea soli TaxID=1032476 RepID=A0A7W0CUH5_9ACTN|nr:MFS transporter [Nonomuraea soli]MBA2897480.1 putative MFS family arabinose efflux permease [Nonomuraea soli]
MGNFAVGTGMFVTAGLVEPIAHDLDVSPAAAGQMMTVFALSYAVLSPVLAAVTARLSRRTVLIMAMVFFVVANVLSALAPTYALVLVTRVLAAVGAAMFTPTASAVASALSPPERRGRALALVMGGVTVAAAIGVPLGTWLGATEWRATLWAVAGLGVVGLVGVLAFVPHLRLEASSRIRDRFAPLADRALLAVLLTQLLMFAAAFSAYTYLDSLIDVPLPAVLWAWGFGAVIGNHFGGRLTDLYGPRRMILLGLAGATLLMALAPVANLALPVALVWSFLWGGLGWLVGPSQLYRTVTAVPGNVPVALGLLSSSQYAGLFVAGMAGGLALEWYGRAGVIVLSSVIGLVALVFTLATYREAAVPVR